VRRPFHFEQIAVDRRGVDVAFDGPDGEALATGQLEFTKRDKLTLDACADFFGELALRCGKGSSSPS